MIPTNFGKVMSVQTEMNSDCLINQVKEDLNDASSFQVIHDGHRKHAMSPI
jgi:hypothetical protein